MSLFNSARFAVPVLLIAGVAFGCPLEAMAKSPKSGALGALEKKAKSASNEEQAAWAKLSAATGGKTPKDAKIALKYRIYDAKVRIDTIEEAIEIVEKRRADMEGDKKRHDDKSIFSPGDVVDKGKGYAGTEPGLRYLKRKTVERAKEGLTGRVAEKAGEAALRRSASRYLGWYGWLMDGVEFGGKKWIKEEVSGTLADYIIQHHKTVSGLNRVIIRILEQINKDLAKLDEIERLEKIYRAAENRAVDAALAVERAKRAAEPATKRAVLRRELDREGDRDEERAAKDKERRDAAKRARIEVVPEDRSRRPRARKNIPTIRMRGKRSRRTSRRIDHRRRRAAHRRRSHRSQRRVEQVVRTGLAIRFGLGGMGRMGRMGRRHHRGPRLHRGRGETFNRSHRRRSRMGRRGEY